MLLLLLRDRGKVLQEGSRTATRKAIADPASLYTLLASTARIRRYLPNARINSQAVILLEASGQSLLESPVCPVVCCHIPDASPLE